MIKELKNMIKKRLVTLGRKTPYDGQNLFMNTVSKYEVFFPYGMYAKATDGSLVCLFNLNNRQLIDIFGKFDLFSFFNFVKYLKFFKIEFKLPPCNSK